MSASNHREIEFEAIERLRRELERWQPNAPYCRRAKVLLLMLYGPTETLPESDNADRSTPH